MIDRKIHLGLGAGNAYGFVHAGVLKALHEQNMRPDKITGVSFGSLIAAFYSKFDCDAHALYDFIDSLRYPDLLGLCDLSIYDRHFFRGKRLERFLRKHLGNMRIKDCPLPVSIYAAYPTDRSIHFFAPDTLLYKAVMASTAVPPMLRIYHGLYDGGFNTLAPAPFLDQKCLRIVADPYNLPRYDKTPLLYREYMDYFILRQYIRARKEGESADIRLTFDLGNSLIIDYRKYRYYMRQGYEQTLQQLKSNLII